MGENLQSKRTGATNPPPFPYDLQHAMADRQRVSLPHRGKGVAGLHHYQSNLRLRAHKQDECLAAKLKAI
jgi:hypothetical protein